MPLRDVGKVSHYMWRKTSCLTRCTREKIDKVCIPILEAIHHLPEKDKEQFVNHIHTWKCRCEELKFNYFNIIKDSSKYCELYCNVLRLGYNTFGDLVLEYTQFGIDNYIPLQSMSSEYKLKEGCSNDVVMRSGVVHHYISDCIVGGRCVANNHKLHHAKRKIADFDACSLYPSAMRGMKEYLEGTPKVTQQSEIGYIF
jgi:hypothetical protein